MECCKSVGVYSAFPYSNEIKEFYETRGAKVEKEKVYDTELAFITFDIPCLHLDSEKGCLIYSKRPKVCRQFPVNDSKLMEKCQLHIQGLL